MQTPELAPETHGESVSKRSYFAFVREFVQKSDRLFSEKPNNFITANVPMSE